MMTFLKVSASILSLVAALLAAVMGASSSSAAAYSNGERSLQASALCIMGGTPFTECCPAADPGDGICTMLWCVDIDNVSVRDSCDCAQVNKACGLVGVFSTAVPG